MTKFLTYEQAEQQQKPSAVNRRLIDGTVTGCGNCVGYCACEDHPGYLNDKLRAEHGCLRKGCDHYLPRRKQSESPSPSPFSSVLTEMQTQTEQVFATAKEMLAPYEGLRLMEISQQVMGEYEITYVTLSNDYPFDTFAKRMYDEYGFTVTFRRLDYSLERITELIFG